MMPDNESTITRRLPNQTGNQEKIVIVSGLPRSGTSMLMHVLEAGGMTLLTDQVRKPDIDNPKGYCEFERVKRLPQGDVEWLEAARGKCLKVISALLTYLPPGYCYDVIFMHRDIGEVLASQRKMLARRGQETRDDDEAMMVSLQKHVDEVRNWVVTQPNFSLLDADYNAILAAPADWVAHINVFLSGNLDTLAMQAAVDSTLYRNRKS
jgi:hypothetical protein